MLAGLMSIRGRKRSDLARLQVAPRAAEVEALIAGSRMCRTEVLDRDFKSRQKKLLDLSADHPKTLGPAGGRLRPIAIVLPRFGARSIGIMAAVRGFWAGSPMLGTGQLMCERINKTSASIWMWRPRHEPPSNALGHEDASGPKV